MKQNHLHIIHTKKTSAKIFDIEMNNKSLGTKKTSASKNLHSSHLMENFQRQICMMAKLFVNETAKLASF